MLWRDQLWSSKKQSASANTKDKRMMDDGWLMVNDG